MVAMARPAPLTMQAISPSEGHVVEFVLGGATLHRIFLARRRVGGQVLLAEEGVGLDVDLGIERQSIAPALVTISGIDLDQTGVAVQVEPVQAVGDPLELRDLRPASPRPNASWRHWKSCRPGRGCTSTRRIFSGGCAATSSMSMPPALEATKRPAALPVQQQRR